MDSHVYTLGDHACVYAEGDHVCMRRVNMSESEYICVYTEGECVCAEDDHG